MDEALKALHHQFVEAYDAASGPDIDDAEERRNFYTWLRICMRPAVASCSTACCSTRSDAAQARRGR
jgi:hypothetical protein